MNAITFPPPTEVLDERDKRERDAYAKRLRAMPTFDVMSEMSFLQARLDDCGHASLQDQPEETLAFLGALVEDPLWNRDGGLAEIHRRRRRDQLQALRRGTGARCGPPAKGSRRHGIRRRVCRG